MPSLNRPVMYASIAMFLMIHLVLLGRIEIAGAKPDILLALVVFIGLFFGSGPGLEAGIVAGFGKDIFAFDYFGANAFILALVGIIAGAVNTKIFRESGLTRSLLVFFFCAFGMYIRILLCRFVFRSESPDISEYTLFSVFPVSAYSSVAALPVFGYLIHVFGLEELPDIV
jgi:rod shape-determining protein MreD